MKFKFKIQDYQTQAVNNVVKVFTGQNLKNAERYNIKIGSMLNTYTYYEYGFKNREIQLTDEELLANIQEIQRENNLCLDDTLNKELGRCSLDIEMETGTGKTYVYIKTIFELNKVYGWSKFIIVVPSIAIREGVKKSFEVMEDHFMETYHKKAHYFIYDSNNLNLINKFAENSGIYVMIVNTQAFNRTMDKTKKASQIIYTKHDKFQSHRPIDAIKDTCPILILDEPQKIGGKSTQKALKENFNALFSLNYSATHKEKHNTVYVLDPLDAYNQRLVKKIEVIGLEIENAGGRGAYLAFTKLILSKNKPPQAELDYEIKLKTGKIKRQTKIFDVGDDVFYASNELNQYKGYVISDIDPKGIIHFQNGEHLLLGRSIHDEYHLTNVRLQIRQTIQAHFEKEARLYSAGIKILSLFFIDEVSKYRIYDENNQPQIGEYGHIFEEEYTKVLNKYLKNDEHSPYQQYLRKYCCDKTKVHNGYFSIDKKTSRFTNGKVSGDKLSEDESAYDLIMKDKERLLSFAEPTRFIFSHSALREGWDNPNIFQICTLRLTGDATQKRQEVGRGLRICVDQNGNRMDYATFEDDKLFESYNTLTVISADSYAKFVDDLQKDIKTSLYNRPTKATKEYFKDKIITVNNTEVQINEEQATAIYQYLVRNNYIDEREKLTNKYTNDKKHDNLSPLPTKIKPLTEAVNKLLDGIYRPISINNARDNKPIQNGLNDNFSKKEFVHLWKYLNHKYIYQVHFDSNELIQESVKAIDNRLCVKDIRYLITAGEQRDKINKEDISNKTAFEVKSIKTKEIKDYPQSQIKYDLIGKIAQGTTLTRKTIVAILKKIQRKKFVTFRDNPEDFIHQVITLINEQKLNLMIPEITYDISSEPAYEEDIFIKEKHTVLEKSFEAKKHVQNLVFLDGLKDSVEEKFLREIEKQDEVAVYAKLPREFKIPTPVGNYTPDWAIAFKEGSVKHIYFVAETKGSTKRNDLRTVEQIKTDCAKNLFAHLNNHAVKYSIVTTFKDLLDEVMH